MYSSWGRCNRQDDTDEDIDKRKNNGLENGGNDNVDI